MLNPINVAGPDDRRKQLMAKLGQQAQQNGAAHAAIPMPLGARAGTAAALGTGTGFRAPGMHALPNPQSTQSPNILANILARLGVGGRPQDNEVSHGLGSPISPYGPNYIPAPAPDTGSPIPAGGAAAGAGAGMVGLNGQPITHVPVAQATAPGPTPTNTGAVQGPSNTIVDTGFYTQGSPPVSLGGGLYYDPSSGQILNLGGPAAGASALPTAGRSFAV